MNKLDKETTDIKNEIQRVSKELAKQNVKTLKELQQVKADMKKSMKKTPSKAGKTPTATTTRQLNQADQDIIEGWIQSRIDKAIEDYTKVNNNNVAAAAGAAAAAKTQRSNRKVVIDGKITQDMILDWIDSAVETFAADRTGKVDYAVHSSGARIVGIGNARMTSSTYLNPNSTLSRRAARVLGLSTHHGPEEVIKPSKGIGRYEKLLLLCFLLYDAPRCQDYCCIINIFRFFQFFHFFIFSFFHFFSVVGHLVDRKAECPFNWHRLDVLFQHRFRLNTYHPALLTRFKVRHKQCKSGDTVV